jgi:hypothetical protein
LRRTLRRKHVWLDRTPVSFVDQVHDAGLGGALNKNAYFSMTYDDLSLDARSWHACCSMSIERKKMPHFSNHLTLGEAP